MPHREVATCFIMNWVSVLLKMFEWSLFPFNSQIAREYHSSSNSSFMPDFKPLYNSAYLPHWIRSSVRLHVRHWFGASRSYGLRPFRVGKLHDDYPSNVSGFLSLSYRTRGTQCVAMGGTQLKLLTAWSPSDILSIFVWDLPLMESANSVRFFTFQVWVARDFSSLRGLPDDMWLVTCR